MRLTQNTIDRFANAANRVERVRAKFAGFNRSLGFFSEPRCPVRGVVVDVGTDAFFSKVSYGTVAIGFRFLDVLSAEGSASGRVVCTLESPLFTETEPVLGCFKFNPQGFTDFEVSEGADPIEVEYMAVEIALHFLHTALERDAP